MAGEAVLVVGGAGYIGSHTCLALSQAGYRVVVYDSLIHGHRAFAKFGPLEIGDVRDTARLSDVIARYKPAAIVHFAALIEAGGSVRDPAPFYDVNVGGVLSLLNAARVNGQPPVVFSSTCATYGAPLTPTLDETHPQWPLNPYGWTKLAAERMFADHRTAYGQRSTWLRYFNAAGCAPEHGLGEHHDPETHVIPLAMFSLLGRRKDFTLFGEDYETRDGTAVRDYVHVLDLADAHVRAARQLIDGAAGDAYNLGTGDGTSVKEIIAAVERASNRKIPLVKADRRPGDAAALVANSAKAARDLGWRPTRSLDDIVRGAWAWHASEEASVFPPGP
ncbi:MAG: UDP-glucose 4-epimerase GalE [Hyphomonadaceae bacterium]|nr:MAG: exoB-3 [Caulobacteraceae bacterium]MBT9446377.1 UDP-glucose 4-epimerase GalE [Hyphomonadaceae bacterium]TPW07867.1 MAG: exoB-3 [Alphaproteobacteria bacterium]